ncbi:MAG: T9SS type A sorting domain-containing protein [Salinivirgaceae bacterium]|nr:T9SS type A sorting domain-containing protein [Salinivirgaceae bacterium]MDD4747821.1 T9SS type A sorting domain-containing protein [Salinivirgaceae bacterium]
MKKLLYTTAFVMSIGIVSSQNWQPIVYGIEYYYALNNSDQITNVIKVDSVQKVESDSIFYLNRIFTNCDTCTDNEYDAFALKNQPQFLMRKMIKKSDSLFQFSDTIQFSVKPLMKYGQMFQYSETPEVNAIVSFEGIETVLEVEDSVKILSLSNGKIVKISKNFGIIYFQQNDNYYNLIGIKNGNSFGVNPLTFNDFFEYEVGDVFQRYSTDWVTADDPSTYRTVTKFSINSKTITGSTIRYEISGWRLHTQPDNDVFGGYSTVANRFSDILTYVDSANHFIHSYPNQLIDINDHLGIYEFGSEKLLNKAEHILINNRRVIKTGNFADEAGEQVEWHPHYSEYSNNSDLLVRNFYGVDEIELMYIEGCGYNLQYWYFEFGGSDTFVGRVHNGDTIGSVSSDRHFEQYASITQNREQKTVVYPNPVKNNSNLKISTDLHVLEYRLIDISGTLISKGNVIGSEIFVNTNGAGLYILELVTQNRTFVERIIVQ